MTITEHKSNSPSIDRLLVDHPKLSAAVRVLIQSASSNNDRAALAKWDELRRMSEKSHHLPLHCPSTTPELKRLRDEDLGTADEVAENGRNIGARSNAEENERLDEMRDRILERNQHRIEKKHRPWRSADEVPAPLMVRERTWVKGRWCYAQTAGPKAGIVLFPISESHIVSFVDAFNCYEQHDGSPCGAEEA